MRMIESIAKTEGKTPDFVKYQKIRDDLKYQMSGLSRGQFYTGVVTRFGAKKFIKEELGSGSKN